MDELLRFSERERSAMNAEIPKVCPHEIPYEQCPSIACQERLRAFAAPTGLAGDKGMKMQCTKCGTEWWPKMAGNSCPACDPKYNRLKSTIMLTLNSKRDEVREIRAKITALEELDAMCGRLDKGL